MINFIFSASILRHPSDLNFFWTFYSEIHRLSGVDFIIRKSGRLFCKFGRPSNISADCQLSSFNQQLAYSFRGLIMELLNSKPSNEVYFRSDYIFNLTLLCQTRNLDSIYYDAMIWRKKSEIKWKCARAQKSNRKSKPLGVQC